MSRVVIVEKLEQLGTDGLALFATGQVKVVAAPGGYTLHTPYHAGFVADLKTQLPGYARRYDKMSKSWWVAEPYLTAAVLDIIGSWFDPALAEELARLQRESAPAIEHIAEVY